MPEWDKAALWEAIEPKLPIKKKKRSRPVLFWFLLVTSFGLLISCLLFNIGLTDLPQANVTDSIANISQNNLSNVKRPQSVSKINGTNNQALFSQNNTGQTVGRSNVNEPFLANIQHEEAAINEIKNQNFQNHLPTGHAGLQYPQSQNQKMELITTLSAPTIFTIPSKEETRDNPQLSVLPILVMQINSPFNHIIPSKEMVMPNKSNPLWKVVIDAQFGLLTSTLHTTLPENDEWLRQKKSINSTKESISLGITIHKSITPKLYLGTGLQYLRMNEVVTARDVKSFISSIPSDSAQYVKDGNSIIYLPGTLQQTQTKGYQIYSPNHWTRWTLPLHLSYKIRLGSLTLLPSVNGSYTFLQRFQGIQIHPNGNYIYKDDLVYNTLYKRSGIFSWGMGLDMEYPLSAHISLATGLFHSNDINSSWNPNYAITEKFTRTGIRLGISYIWK